MIANHNARSNSFCALALFVCCFSVYSLTLSESQPGYEGETIDQTRAFVRGEEQIEGRAGLLAIGFYVPFVAVDEWVKERGLFPSFYYLTSLFALPFIMTLTAVLVFLAALEIWSNRIALGVALIFAFGTMAWPYSKMGMESALTIATTLAAWGFIREVRNPRQGGYMLIALGLGGILLTKVQGPLVILLFLLTISIALGTRTLRPPRPITFLGMVVILLVAMALFLWGNQIRFGRWFLSNKYDMGWESAPPRSYLWNLLGFLISPGKSVFIYSPPLLLSAAILIPFCRRHRWFLYLLIFFVVPQILLHAYFRTWADESWGPRRLMNLVPILILPVGMILESLKDGRRLRRWLFGSIALGGLAMQLLAVSMNYASYIWTLQPRGLGSQETIVWNPATTAYRFQARLLASSVSRWMDRGSLTFRAEDEYLPWNAPDEEPPPAIEMDLSKFDEHLDFWWAGRAARDPDWIRADNKSAYLFAAFCLLATLSTALIVCVIFGVGWSRFGLGLLMFFFAATTFGSSARLSPAYDEPAHVRSGLTLMTRSVYVDVEKAWWTRIDPLTPPMDMAPGLLARWSGQTPDYREEMVTGFGHIRIARIANHFFGGCILLLVFVWARDLWGPGGAFVSTLMVSLTPLFLAHSSIVSTDLYMTLGGMIAAYTIWKVFLSRPKAIAGGFNGARWFAPVCAGLAVAFAICCKVSNSVFLPIMIAAIAWAEWTHRIHGDPPSHTVARGLIKAVVACGVALGVAALVYEFSRLDLDPIEFGGRSITLPFGHTLAKTMTSTMGLAGAHPDVFFNGKVRSPGAFMYPAAMLVKTPLALLVLTLMGAATAMALAFQGEQRRTIVYIFGLSVLFALTFATRGFYLGLRHMMFPIVLFSVLGGSIMKLNAVIGMKRAKIPLAVAGVFLLMAAIEVAASAPWHLSYFNRVGRNRPMFVDSDGDWGEGLIALRNWQRVNSPDEPIWLAYFGSSRPEDFGIEYRGLLSPFSFTWPDDELERGPDPNAFDGFVAISRTQLAGTYMPVAQQKFDYYAKWRELEPDAVVGGAINIYDLRKADDPPDEPDSSPELQPRS